MLKFVCFAVFCSASMRVDPTVRWTDGSTDWYKQYFKVSC